MATTTNFGWETPDDTDLVKDGAAAMRTLGNSIDTSFVDLKGGTTGQLLAKNSNTNLDYLWVDPSTGDITGITAGTGISGGGTSGTVTVTNSMATAITTAGDLIKGTGSGTFDRLGIGSAGQVLTVASGAPAWATPSAPAFAGCIVTGNASISCTNNADTTITWNTELLDTNNFHSTSTNTGRITIPVAGKYNVFFEHYISQGGAGERASSLFLNGTYYALTTKHASATNVATVNNMSLTMDLAVNDYLETKVFQDSGAGRDLLTKDATWLYSWFGVTYLGA